MTNRFQKNIIRIMKQRNLTQLGLSKIIRIRQSQVSNWVNGISLPNYTSLVTLCDKLGIEIAEFFK